MDPRSQVVVVVLEQYHTTYFALVYTTRHTASTHFHTGTTRFVG